MTSVDRTAYPGFARVVSARELAEAFMPTEAEVGWARGRTQDEHHLLALVVWLKSYQRLGCFPKVEDVPAAVVGHVRGVLGLAGEVELRRAAPMSASRHRAFVRERLGVVYDAPRVRRRCELPGHTTLDAMAASIRAEVNTGFFQTVAGRLDGAARRGWPGCWWWTR